MNSRLIFGILVCVALSGLRAEQFPTPDGSVVDAKGVWHQAKEYHGKRPPWINDLTHMIGAAYGEEDQRRHNRGTGLFRLTLDLKTGKVTDIVILKSTGFRTLNRNAVFALHQWRWKPGKWKQIDIPVTFGATEPIRLTPGSFLIPNP